MIQAVIYIYIYVRIYLYIYIYVYEYVLTDKVYGVDPTNDTGLESPSFRPGWLDHAALGGQARQEGPGGAPPRSAMGGTSTAPRPGGLDLGKTKMISWFGIGHPVFD